MKNAIRAVPYALVVFASAITTYSLLSGPMRVEANSATKAMDFAEEQEVVEVLVMQMQDATPVSEGRVIEYYTLTSTLDTMGSVSMRNINGVTINTDKVLLNSDALMEALDGEYLRYDWDVKNKIEIAHVLWEFLVNQQGVNGHNAAAIIGSVMCEGRFSEEESTHNTFNNIEAARAVLGDGERGYGIAQWTYHRRQKSLLEYYELANDMYPDDFRRAAVVAECCMLVEEIKAYEVFDDLYSYTTIEDAVGRMSVIYEKYDGCYEQWSNTGGQYRLVSNSGSGKTRLAYAENIYALFTE